MRSDVCRSSTEAPQEAVMLQLSEELAYVHQAYACCHAMRDRLAASMVCCAPAREYNASFVY